MVSAQAMPYHGSPGCIPPKPGERVAPDEPYKSRQFERACKNFSSFVYDCVCERATQPDRGSIAMRGPNLVQLASEGLVNCHASYSLRHRPWCDYRLCSFRTNGPRARPAADRFPAAKLRRQSSMQSQKGDDVDDYIQKSMARQHIPGLSLVVVKDGEIRKIRDMVWPASS